MLLTPRLCCASLILVLSVQTILQPSAHAQEGKISPLYLEGVRLNGLHTFVTDSWVTAEITVVNPNSMGRDCRVVVFYASRPDVQYARDLWVPGKSSLSAWVALGPAPTGEMPGSAKQKNLGAQSTKPQELQALIYDRMGEQERLVLPRSEERIRSRLASYQAREPVTCVLMDEKKPKDPGPNRYPTEPPEPEDVVDLVRAFRASAQLSEHVKLIDDSILPPTAETFDGVDHFIVAGRRLADDPPGQIALSRWLRQGGRLWVMLDQTDASLVGQILEEAPGFQIVDRTTLTRVLIKSSLLVDVEPEIREFERPVEFVRVEVGPAYTILHRVNGWPASFTRTVGMGRVLFTTLGARAWCRERKDTDSKSPFENIPDVPVILPPTESLANLLQPPQTGSSDTRNEDWNLFLPLVKEEIGYSVVSVGTAGMIFAGFLLLVLLLGMGLRRWGRSELLGWLGPVAALLTGGAFMAIGEASRRAVPPTVAVTEMVTVKPKTLEQPVTGLLGLFQPDGGPTQFRSNAGGILDLDMSGLEGQTRHRIVTDIDQWHWEKLALPAGLRLGSLQCVIRTDPPMSCVARFGPQGLEGKVSPGQFQGLTDALIQAPSQRCFAVRLQADGGFAVGDADLLPAGQFLAETVLSDRQQRRQRIYQQLFGTSSSFSSDRLTIREDEQSRFVVWADPVPAPFVLGNNPRWAGSALLAFPLEWERTPPGQVVTVPRAFVSYRRLLDTGVSQPTLDGTSAIEQHLRFQLPSSVLPLKVEEARLFAKVSAPSRRFAVFGRTQGKRLLLGTEESPVDPLQIDIVGNDIPLLDDQGGLHFDVEVSDAAPEQEERAPKWSIQALELEIVGQTMERK